MTSFEPSDPQWWAMCDAQMGMPVPLAQAPVNEPFVYDRDYGVFPVAPGHHHQAMALLLAFRHGMTCPVDVTRHLGLRDTEAAAEAWLSTPGTAMRSSVGRGVKAGHPGTLTAMELRWLGPVEWLLDDEVSVPRRPGNR